MFTENSDQAVVEQALHDAFRCFVQQACDKHGIKVLEASVDWLDVSTMEDQRHMAISVSMRTETFFSTGSKDPIAFEPGARRHIVELAELDNNASSVGAPWSKK